MDLDDSFTEGLVQRMKARKEYLNKKKSEYLGKKRAVLIDEHQVNSDEPPNKSPKYQAYSPEEKDKRRNEDCNSVFVPVSSTSDTRGIAALRNEQPNKSNWQSSYSAENKENAEMQNDVDSPFVTGLSVPRAKGLAALKKSTFQREEMDSTSELEVNKCNMYVFSTNSKDLCLGSKSRLAAFAADVRKWEDDIPKSTSPSKVAAPPSTNTNASSSNSVKCSTPQSTGGLGMGNIGVGSGQKKSQVWGEAIAATLENPISLSSPVKTITGTCNDLMEKSKDEHAYKNSSGSFKFDCDQMKPSKETKLPEPKSFAAVDPAELPLSARKALFENALMKGTPNWNKDITDPTLSVAQRAAMFERQTKANFNTQTVQSKFQGNSDATSNIIKAPVKDSGNHIASIQQKLNKKSPIKDNGNHISSIQLKLIQKSPIKDSGNHIASIQQKLNKKCEAQEVEAKFPESPRLEISNLVHQWENMSSSNGKSCLNEGDLVSTSLNDPSVPTKDFVPATHIPPMVCVPQEKMELLSEEEIPCDSEEDQCDPNDSSEIDREVFEDEEKEDCSDEEEDSLESDQGDKMSLKTDEVKTNFCEKPNIANIPRSRSPSWSGMSSYDSSYCASGSQSDSSVRSSEENRKGKNPEVPLLYTVSFYRKQKQETRLTPVRTVVHCNKENSSESTTADHTEYIHEQIKALQEEILRHQTVISQTSQALNLCSCTVEFSGSLEQVEAERLLLISTQKRQACLNEVTRLKAFGSQGENVAEGKGTLTISDLQLPLKREFIASQLEGKLNDSVHYFLCLIRHGAQVVVTQMMSTDDKTTDGALCFTNHIQLQNLPADFSVVFEVYALQTKKEVLSHEKKYHIKREHSKIRLTPKGKKADGKILLPAISSPGGPTAVRSPSFGVVGFTRFTLLNCTKKAFTLDKVPFTSPLEGVLRVRLQLHAEHKITEKGFLTMFEDVSGFGAWHRRWCALDTNCLSFWKYPDDEHKKEPIVVIDLKQCVASEIKLAPRDICARPHTLQLVTVRPQEKGDKNTLISRSVNTLTTTKHLLSADTKEERILWCNKLNEALASVRKWDPRALKPVNPT